MNTDFIYCSVMTKDEETFTTGILTKKFRESVRRYGLTAAIEIEQFVKLSTCVIG
ncbi:hypothetical protein MOD24_17055 [Bacillus haynesii]|uniref:hypothetical protein n=1 Tax=Bacillus haynesii TaxID=1925021 RepID=UPI00227F8300|nr:hypothetical protein [Bacillus haynesii]MCY8577555.1 hypothetical protein [Bacillus haynesii]MEC1657098.1 hypothetical protein [Bacillus haynesii]